MSKNKQISTSQRVENYIRTRPSIREAFALGIVNSSALARVICREQGIEEYAAAQAACKRFERRLKNETQSQDKIRSLLKAAQLRVRTKMIVVTTDRLKVYQHIDKLYSELRQNRAEFNLVEGESSYTLISEEKYFDQIRAALGHGVLRIQEDLVQLALIFPPEIERTAGIAATVYSYLYRNGVNIREEFSCWTDLSVVIHARDLQRALSVLSELLEEQEVGLELRQ